MDPLPLHFKTILALLHTHQVEYLLVGGYAVRYYGYARATRDLDLWTSRRPANVARIVAALQDFAGDLLDLHSLRSEQLAEALAHERRIIRINLPPPRLEILDPLPGGWPKVLLSFTGEQAEPDDAKQTAQIEFLTLQSGVLFEDCFPERTPDTLDGIKVNLISLRHLRVIKQAGGRPHDLDDLAHLP